MMHYSLDPGRMELTELEDLIKEKDLLPGRVLLKKDLHENFLLLKKEGIRNLKELLSTLGSPAKLRQLAGSCGLDENWLILLKREAGSYIGKPFPLEKFPGIPYEYAEVLRSKGIRNTRELYEEMQLPGNMERWTEKTGIPLARLKELYILCDLSRINGVGPWFARILYQTGIHSVEVLAGSDAESQLKSYEKARQESNTALPALSTGDMKHCISYAKVLCLYDSNDPSFY